jgi:hypothetical protein
VKDGNGTAGGCNDTKRALRADEDCDDWSLRWGRRRYIDEVEVSGMFCADNKFVKVASRCQVGYDAHV